MQNKPPIRRGTVLASVTPLAKQEPLDRSLSSWSSTAHQGRKEGSHIFQPPRAD